MVMASEPCPFDGIGVGSNIRVLLGVIDGHSPHDRIDSAARFVCQRAIDIDVFFDKLKNLRSRQIILAVCDLGNNTPDGADDALPSLQ